MDRQVLLRKIMATGDDVRRLEQDLIALQSIDVVEYPDNYSSLSHQAIIKGEFIACKLRELAYSTTNISWTELLKDSANALEILIDCDEKGVVEISLPCLIPSRKKKPLGFITAPLYAALEKFILSRHNAPEDPFEKFSHCTICISHIYDKRLFGRGRKRDHDNIEVKGIIDVINTFLLTDDTGNLCDIFHTSEVSEIDMTRIFIMKKDMFPEWVSVYKSRSASLP